MTTEQAEKLILKSGYKRNKYNFLSVADTAMRFYKVFDEENTSVSIDVTEITSLGHIHTVWTISIRAEANNNEWADLNFYSLSMDALKNLDDLESKLRAAWAALNEDGGF